jgi:hypothetical protein
VKSQFNYLQYFTCTLNIFSGTTERRKKEKKKKECLLASEVEGCVKVLQTKILPEGVEIFV